MKIKQRMPSAPACWTGRALRPPFLRHYKSPIRVRDGRPRKVARASIGGVRQAEVVRQGRHRSVDVRGSATTREEGRIARRRIPHEEARNFCKIEIVLLRRRKTEDIVHHEVEPVVAFVGWQGLPVDAACIRGGGGIEAEQAREVGRGVEECGNSAAVRDRVALNYGLVLDNPIEAPAADTVEEHAKKEGGLWVNAMGRRGLVTAKKIQRGSADSRRLGSA